MNKEKEEPLSINNNKQRGRHGSVSKRKRGSSLRQKRKPQPKSSLKYYILAFVIFIILFCFLGFLIYKNLKKIQELDKSIKKRNKELESGEKTRIELLDRIEVIQNQIEDKEKEIKEKKKFDEEKLTEYNEQKKIYENIEKLQNEIIDENMTSLCLDEAINNLNNRINLNWEDVLIEIALGTNILNYQ